MEQKKNRLIRFSHHNMALVGGFLGGYAILCREDFLGNAQTANLVYLVHAILGQDFFEVFLRLIALSFYFSAAMIYVFVREKTQWSVKKMSLGIDLIAIIILGFIPLSVDPIIGLFPIFFAMSFQWNAFSGCEGYVSSTIFSTNNTRQIALSIAEFLCNRDPMKIHKAIFFLGSLICFHVGVIISYFTTLYIGVHGVWIAILFLIPAYIFVYKEETFEVLENQSLDITTFPC